MGNGERDEADMWAVRLVVLLNAGRVWMRVFAQKAVGFFCIARPQQNIEAMETVIQKLARTQTTGLFPLRC